MGKLKINLGYEYQKDGTKVILLNTPVIKAQIKKRALIKKVSIISVPSVLAFLLLLNFVIMPLTGSLSRVDKMMTYNGDNPYIVFDERMQISAHRAGGNLAPEQTLTAFELCLESPDYIVDILEFDLHLTKDDKLILLHDGTLDRTSDSVDYFKENDIYAKDKTYEDISKLNFGYNFKDSDGNYPYREADADLSKVRILLLDDILKYVEDFCKDNNRAEMEYIIEIKDDGKVGERAMDKLAATIHEFDIADRTIVGTFNNNVTKHIDENHSDLIRSASITEVLDFYFAFLYGIDFDKKDVKYKVLQIPYIDTLIDLTSPALIDYAHHYDIAVQYWTINDADKIQKLMENGADCVITDNPDVAYDVVFG